MLVNITMFVYVLSLAHTYICISAHVMASLHIYTITSVCCWEGGEAKEECEAGAGKELLQSE